MTAELIATHGDTMTFNEALGFSVNQYLFAHHLTREQLGELLGVTRTVAGKKLRGQVGWSAEDVAVVAHRFGLRTDDLMPRKIEETPVAGGDEGSEVVPGQDSNLRPSAPEADALSTELPGPEA